MDFAMNEGNPVEVEGGVKAEVEMEPAPGWTLTLLYITYNSYVAL